LLSGVRTLDRLVVRASVERAFALATDVERWPILLRHYRWVRVLAREPCTLVEMAAWRPFGPLRYPTWWVSEMTVDPERRLVRYRHVRGITTGMNVEWRVTPQENGVHLEIEHWWRGPRWPVIGGLAAALVIGPIFIHSIASRTLAGLKAAAEASCIET
jgi:ribosome-associated toxin RatA of RatAB toxin-antitoxin module